MSEHLEDEVKEDTQVIPQLQQSFYYRRVVPFIGFVGSIGEKIRDYLPSKRKVGTWCTETINEFFSLLATLVIGVMLPIKDAKSPHVIVLYTSTVAFILVMGLIKFVEAFVFVELAK